MKCKFSRLFLERLEDRCVPSTTRTWTGIGTNDLWSNPANWDTGLPAIGDAVVIPDVAGSNEVIFDNSVAGGISVNSLSCDEPFRITAAANTSATLTLAATGTFSFNSTLTISAGSLNANGVVNLNSSLTQSGGTLGGTGSVTVAGLVSWSGGTMSGTGATNANGGMILTGNLTNSRTIDNAGAASYDGVGNSSFGAGTFNNLATGTFSINGNNDIGGTAFNNQGRFVKQAGASGDGITRFTGAFNNTGTVSLESGTLSFEGSDTSTGDLDALAGTTLQFASASTHNFNTGADISAAGLVLFASASPSGVNFNVGSTYSVTGNTQITSGVNSFNGTCEHGDAPVVGRHARRRGHVHGHRPHDLVRRRHDRQRRDQR
jgi:hypothetical protein